MSEAKKETTIFEIADQFIALANEISAKEKDVGKVGTGMRFAAARFNAFEASLKSSDLAAEKDNALEWFSNEYKEMLKDNLEDHIKMSSQPIAEKPANDDSVQVFKS